LEHFNWELFTYMKNCFEITALNSNEELMEGVKAWLSAQVAHFFDTGM
jgi:hypothetical protein